MLNIEEAKKNNRTSFLAESYERLLREQEDLVKMLAENPDMAEMGEEEMQNIKTQMEALEKKIEDIMKAEEAEEEFPNEIIMEFRAGAGGD